MLPRWWVIAALASVLALAAACGDDGDDEGDANGAPDATPTAAATQSGPANQPPTASFTAEPSCTSSNSTEVTFTSTSTDPDGDELSHSWDIRSGNPSSATGQVVSGVTFPNVRAYPVTLSVDDARGGTDSATMNMAPC